MTPLFKKLNLGTQSSILVLNSPESFEGELQRLDGVQIRKKATAKTKSSFSIAFAVTQKELDRLSATLIQSAEEDAILWVAYPKGTSKKYKCEFNRDSGWTVLGGAGYEPVRMVAIDDDWSALRFRLAEKIRTMQRSNRMAISEKGKQRTQGNK